MGSNSDSKCLLNLGRRQQKKLQSKQVKKTEANFVSKILRENIVLSCLMLLRLQIYWPHSGDHRRRYRELVTRSNTTRGRRIFLEGRHEVQLKSDFSRILFWRQLK